MRRPYLLVVGAILSIGFAWYLTALPATIFKLLGYSLPLLHLAAMSFVRQGLRAVAGLLLLPHITIKGNPNNEFFSAYIEVLYSLSYAVKMSPKAGIEPKGYFEYAV